MTRNKIKAKKQTKTPPVKMGDIVTGEVIDITFQGLGVVKIDGYPVFVVDTIPGELVEIKVNRVLANYAFGDCLKIIKESPDRVKVSHNQLITSGIAPLVNLKYEAQLKLKQKQVESLFRKNGIEVEVEETIGMEKPYHYRNKTVVPIQKKDGKLITGFYKRGSHNLVPIEDYYLNDPKIDEAIVIVRDILDKYDLSVWDDDTKEGELRYLMVRRGYYSHEMMVGIISATKSLTHEEEIIEDIKQALPELKSLILNYNPRQTNVLLGTENRVLYGRDHIEDTLLGKKYEISLNSFYQVNPQTTEILYELAADKANLSIADIAIDAYSGIGTIGLTISDRVKQVLGVEVVEPAVLDAKNNAEINKITNAEFIVADAPTQMVKWKNEGLTPDVVFVDPPRKGLTKELISAIGIMRPKTFAYISCNPATLARDAVDILNEGYSIFGKVYPVDQFPQTTHVESVVIFKDMKNAK